MTRLTRQERQEWLTKAPYGTKIAVFLDNKLSAVAEKIKTPPPPSRFSTRSDPFWLRVNPGTKPNDVKPGTFTGWYRYKDEKGATHVVRYEPVTADIQVEWDDKLLRGQILGKIATSSFRIWDRMSTTQLLQIEQMIDLVKVNYPEVR
jgi:hypothetical protein